MGTRIDAVRSARVTLARLAVALLVSVSTGAAVMAAWGLDAIFTDPTAGAGALSDKLLLLVTWAYWGASLGLLLGTPLAFVTLIVLRPATAWRAYFPLTLGAVLGQLVQLAICARLPRSGAQAIPWTALPIGALFGGVAAAAWFRRRERSR